MNAKYVFDSIANEIVLKSYVYKNNDTQYWVSPPYIIID